MNPVALLNRLFALICSIRSPPLAARPRWADNVPTFSLTRLDTMKTGMNLLLWTTHVTDEHFPLIARLKKAGFDGVELPLFEGDKAHYTRIATELKNNGLGC